MLGLIDKVIATTVLRLRAVADDDGQTLVEYALIIGVVAVGLIAALTTLKTQVEALFTVVSNALAAAG